MFRKAWKLDLAADEHRYIKRQRLQDQLCNAIAYYCFLKSSVKEGAERIPAPQLIKVDTSIDRSRHDVAALRLKTAGDVIKTCDEMIESKTRKAIELHFIDGKEIKVAGRGLQGLRHDPNSVGFAFQLSVRKVAEELFKTFNSKSDDHEFHEDFVRSETLDLVLRINHRVKKSA